MVRESIMSRVLSMLKCVWMSLQTLRVHTRRHRKETREKVKNKSDNCVFGGGYKEETCAHTCFWLKGHPTSSSLISAVHTQCVSQFLPLFFPPLFFFFKSIISCSFPAAFSSTACHSPLSSVWSLSSSAPWKPSASWQKCTSAHTRPYSLQKGHSIWIFLFPAAPRRHGKAQARVCVAETSAFYRLGDKNDWAAPTHLH